MLEPSQHVLQHKARPRKPTSVEMASRSVDRSQDLPDAYGVVGFKNTERDRESEREREETTGVGLL